MRLSLAIALLCALTAPVAGAELSGTAKATGKPVQNAVVWLDAPGAPPLVQTKPVVLNQRNLDFDPRVLAVRVGTKVDFPNNDKVFHNVFSFRDGRKFDLGVYPVGTSKPIVFNQKGLSRIFCNIHPHMAAYVMAVDTPYFALSNEQGMFTLAGVPAGSYTYHAWRPGGQQEITGTVTVGPSQATAGAARFEVQWP
jgi:plastocyanin